jgi:PhoPQ-activated pathogenicity-related protein
MFVHRWLIRGRSRRARSRDSCSRLAIEPLEDRTLLTAGAPATLTALDAYVSAPDSSYHYSLNSTLFGPGYTDYVIDMTSQTWRSTSEVDRTAWQHWLQIVIPSTVQSKTAVLGITGGSNTSTPPATADSMGVFSATALGAVTVILPTVPNEPLLFAGETSPRTEDQIIAYTFNQYLNGGDQQWPLLLPMVKSAVRAMDTAQSFLSSLPSPVQINDFIVEGGSKRGWTTWLTPAVDSRVRAIVPFVFDGLNFNLTIPHHKDTYVGVTQDIVGGYSSAIQDYTNLNIFDRMGTPQGQALGQIVDPYNYLSRPAYDIPKYLVDSTGDQFFVPDSAQFYFHDLPGQNYIRYVPNTDHGLNFDAFSGAVNYEKALLDGAALPNFHWAVLDSGTTIDVDTVDTPAGVKMWQATNPNNRDFRLETFGANWTSSVLPDQGGGHYVAHVSVPATGATAFFIELTYNVDGRQLIFTTQISTVPLLVPTVVAFDASGPYTGQPFAAGATATGRAGGSVPGNFAFTYYPGTMVTGSGSSTPPTNVGMYTVVASFTSTNPAYVNGQSAPVTFTISKAQTTSMLTSSDNPSSPGERVTFIDTITAVAPGGGTATGLVTFSNGKNVLGSAVLNSSGQAIFISRPLPRRDNSITAIYLGDANFHGSTSSLTQSVSKTSDIASNLPSRPAFSDSWTTMIISSPALSLRPRDWIAARQSALLPASDQGRAPNVARAALKSRRLAVLDRVWTVFEELD